MLQGLTFRQATERVEDIEFPRTMVVIQQDFHDDRRGATGEYT